MTGALLALLGACVLGLAASIIFTWASSKSALWNMAFGAALVLVGAAGLLLAVIVLVHPE